MIPFALKVIGCEDYILIPDCEGSDVILSSDHDNLECLLTTSLWIRDGSFLKWTERESFSREIIFCSRSGLKFLCFSSLKLTTAFSRVRP